MTLISRVPQPPRQQPKEWLEILTDDPARPKNGGISEASIVSVCLFAAALVFIFSLVIIRPFLLSYHATAYPFLATASFTSIALVGGALALLIIITITILLKPLRKWKEALLKVILVGLSAIVAAWFLFLFIQEVWLWLNAKDYLPHDLLTVEDLIQAIRYLINSN